MARRRASGFTKGVSPYQKHQKTPYPYPKWCQPGEPLPEWLRADLRRLHRAAPVMPLGRGCVCMGCR